MDLPLFSFVRHSIDAPVQAVKQRLRQWKKPDNHTLVLNAALDLTRSKSELMLETPSCASSSSCCNGKPSDRH
jgi:hypothetical protein